jgi:GMP synthase (glutamine-hydrolysing)
MVVQWHYEAFSLPAGASRLASSTACPNQAFAWGGIHLGMQFHFEVDAWKSAAWLAADADELERFPDVPSVQTAERLAADSERLLGPMRDVAFRLYDTWADGLRR